VQSEVKSSDIMLMQMLWPSDYSFNELILPDSSDAESEASPCIRIDYSSPQIDSSPAITVV
jgi:hypothetical protein